MEKQVERNRYNKAPALTKRIAGGLIDACILFILYYLFFSLCLGTPLANNYHANYEEMIQIQDKYKLETGYGQKTYTFDENTNYKIYQDEAGSYIVVNMNSITKDVYDSYKSKLDKDEDYGYASYKFKVNSYFLKIFSGFVAEFICLLIVPLCNKRRASVGKLLSGTQLISTTTDGYARWYQLSGRFVWIFLIESSLPLLFLSELYTLIFMPIIMIIVAIINKENRTIHDFISATKVIDCTTFIETEEEAE